jgi:hypothetical protein
MILLQRLQSKPGLICAVTARDVREGGNLVLNYEITLSLPAMIIFFDFGIYSVSFVVNYTFLSGGFSCESASCPAEVMRRG